MAQAYPFGRALFWKDHPLVALDLCGAVKGYAVDLLVEKLKKLNLKSLYVEWGGEIKTFGSHPHERAWKVAIFGLDEKLELTNLACATSGNYLQNWQEGEKTVTHIIDPFNNKPLEVTDTSIASVTVLAEDCLQADALATSLMLFPSKDEATLWAEKRRIKILVY